VFRDLITERVGAEMGGLAKKFNRRFGIAIFEFAIGRAHTAESLNLTAIANRWASPRLAANLAQRAFPAFAETSFPDVVALLMRNDANTHRSVGIDGAAAKAATALIPLPEDFCWRAGPLRSSLASRP
jgi:hypothetical protein